MINSKILKSIQKNFEISLHEDNNNINKDINTLSQSYKNFMDIINESFDFNSTRTKQTLFDGLSVSSTIEE